MQISEKYRNKKIAVVGFGLEGRATYEYLKRHSLDAVIFDGADEQSFLSENPELDASKVVLGEDYLSHLSGYDVIFRTPGISPMTPELVEAKNNGTTVTSQVQEFLESCPATTVGVTGTKGKGTTSTLIFEILKQSGKKVFLGGNIGTPAISFLDDVTPDSIVVLELSSFQLQDLHKSPNVAVLLNITSEHLDYHKDTAEYREAKSSIVRFQSANDAVIANADYDVTMNMAELTPATKLFFSRYKEVDGCFVDNQDEIRIHFDGIDSSVAKVSEMQLRGRHNLENITAAVSATASMGIPVENIRRTITNFRGLEHRLEFVSNKNGVKYYNDSFSTVPETVIAALSSFTEPIVLIAGGSSKNSDYTELGRAISAANLRGLILIGDTAEEIERSIKHPLKVPVIMGLTSMDEIVAKSHTLAQSGDVVLLSPACASFGLFKNYKDRGDQFKAEVNKL